MDQENIVSAEPQPKTFRPFSVRFRLRTFTVRETDPSKWQAGLPTRSSEDVFRLALSIYRELDADKEHFVVLCLTNKHRLSGFKVISTGSLTASLVHPREVYTAALELRAAAIIFVHNHPSGDPAPSPEDIDITKRLKEIGDVMGIRVRDHIVLGQDRYFSFSDRNMI